MTILVGSDHAGLALKATIQAHLHALGHAVHDVGTYSATSCDYPDYAHALGMRVAAGEGLGILVCGTGQGMAMAANRVAGIRAAVCSDVFSASATRLHNDANVLCLGERVVGPGLALLLVDTFLNTAFEGGRHQRRIDKLQPR